MEDGQGGRGGGLFIECGVVGATLGPPGLKVHCFKKKIQRFFFLCPNQGNLGLDFRDGEITVVGLVFSIFPFSASLDREFNFGLAECTH